MTRLLPLLLRPKALAVRNRWRKNLNRRSQHTRDIIIVLFSFAVMYGLYAGTLQSLIKVNSAANMALVSPALPLGLVFLLLGVMLLFSNAVNALGALFLSHDLDLVLASPVSMTTFVRSKIAEVLLSSTWMALVFGLPVIVGFGVFYQAGIEYYLVAFAALLPYFIIASALSIAAVTLFAYAIPASRTREILLVICALAMLGIYFIGKMIFSNGGGGSINDLLRVVSAMTFSNQLWSPSYWVAVCLGEALAPTRPSIFPYLLLLYSVCTALVSLDYLLVRSLHHAAYSKARSTRHGIRINSRRSQDRLGMLLPFVEPPYRALIAKEFKIFARDMTQAVQLLLLLGLCMIYLYNFNVLSAVEGLPQETKVWWQGFLIISNLSMGAFVVAAVGTRFVFPSTSLEGQAWWILQSCPLTPIEILRAKFWAWFVPVGFAACVIFASGAFAINAEPHIVVLNALSSWFIAYGIVGMAVGLGAFFANFSWEHASQLAASFGSLVFMLTSTLLIGLNMIPTSVLIFFRSFKNNAHTFTPFEWYVGVASSALLMMYLNFAATRWAINLGAQALEERRT